jgi:hypothetical protein
MDPIPAKALARSEAIVIWVNPLILQSHTNPSIYSNFEKAVGMD